MMPLRIAIVGMGAWGLCVLDRFIAQARRLPATRQLVLHLVEPNLPGPGVHAEQQPDYLLLNTVCGQVCIFGERGFSDDAGIEQGPTLYEWARLQGYRIDETTLDATLDEGRELTPHDFLPRRVLGAYLRWAYERLLASRPNHVEVKWHAAYAVDLRATEWDREQLTLSDGERIEIDHAFLTTGHTDNVAHASVHYPGPCLRPYPSAALLDAIEPGATVSVAGMGLVAVDVVTALTIGLGGRYQFDAQVGRRRYLPSGREPRILMFSRNGLPFCCRPAVSMDATDSYRPVAFTADAVAALPRGGIDFMHDLWPLLRTEMKVAYYLTHVAMADGAASAERRRVDMVDAWRQGALDKLFNALAVHYGRFDPDAQVFVPEIAQAENSARYQQTVYRVLGQDVAESAKGEERSPLKFSLELFRVLRDNLRLAIDFGGLSAASATDFRRRIASLITRAVVGPPLRRGEEMLALIEAGVVRMPFGPSPRVSYDATIGRWRVASTQLQTPFACEVDAMVLGYLEQPGVDRSASPLLSRLHAAGRVRAGAGGSGVNVNRDGHPIAASGDVEPRLWVLGPLTEGTKYFNHYVPSPKSRFNAFREADRCARAILGSSGIVEKTISESRAASVIDG